LNFKFNKKTNKQGLTTEKIQQGLNNFQKIEDPNDYLKYLEEREFIVKNEILQAYAQVVSSGPKFRGDVWGGYISKNFLDTKKEKAAFRKKLIEICLSKKEAQFYEKFLSSSDIIVFPDKILENEFFLKALPHERMHREFKKLPKKIREKMYQAVKDFMWEEKEGTQSELRILERTYPGKFSGGGAIVEISLNPEEFYTYLAQGELEESTEIEFAKMYPQEYKQYSLIKIK